jgi:hypothetical protein
MSEQSEPPAPLMTWRVHPAVRRPQAAFVAVVVIVLFSVAAAVGFGHSAWGVLSAVVLILSLNRFFMPSSFAIDDAGLTAQFPLTSRRLEWRTVRRFEPSEHEVVLSMNLRRTRLNARRELRVPFGSEKVRVLELIRSHLPAELATKSRRARSEEQSEASIGD